MIQSNYPKFLVIRFPFGAAGNFVASCLQCSVGVGHWSPDMETAKPDTDWLGYFKSVFTPNYSEWMTNEPSSRYSLGVKEIFSSYYERGNDIEGDRFTAAESACHPHYFDLRSQDKYIPIFWMKPFFPAYFERATFVDIFLDDDSIRWYDKAHYKKHFKIIHEGEKLKVFNMRHLPSLIPSAFKGTNQYITYFDSFREFVKQEIIDNPVKDLFRDADAFDDCSGDRPRHSMFLSDVLDREKFISHYYQICDMLAVSPLSLSIISELHKLWLECHDF